MALHPLAEGFADVVDSYERGRPDYPLAVVGALAAELGVGAGAPVLDLAAGTGKLTRALLAAGLDVVAVEPQGPMRDRLVQSVGAERVREGVAEAIPLADDAVDAVTVADAFHWFEHAPALEEMRRVLRPRGGLAVLSVYPDWSGASWAHELGSFIAELRPKHPHFDGLRWQDSVRGTGHWSEPREIRMTIIQPAGVERVVDHVASMSWMAALPQQQRVSALAHVGELVRAGETPPELPVHIVLGLASLL